MGTPYQSYGTSLAIWDHSVTCHRTQVNAPRLTPAMHAGTWFTYPGGMEGWVDVVDLIAPGRESNQRPFDHESDTEPLHHQDNFVFVCDVCVCVLYFRHHVRLTLTIPCVLPRGANCTVVWTTSSARSRTTTWPTRCLRWSLRLSAES